MVDIPADNCQNQTHRKYKRVAKKHNFTTLHCIREGSRRRFYAFLSWVIIPHYTVFHTLFFGNLYHRFHDVWQNHRAGNFYLHGEPY